MAVSTKKPKQSGRVSMTVFVNKATLSALQQMAKAGGLAGIRGGVTLSAAVREVLALGMSAAREK